jgi:hypothetical protein
VGILLRIPSISEFFFHGAGHRIVFFGANTGSYRLLLRIPVIGDSLYQFLVKYSLSLSPSSSPSPTIPPSYINVSFMHRKNTMSDCQSLSQSSPPPPLPPQKTNHHHRIHTRMLMSHKKLAHSIFLQSHLLSKNFPPPPLSS